jgi:2-polyprenyl-3-methyl-5-hydroxy-6-metoxy-1,4-benzoquinol methylase
MASRFWSAMARGPDVNYFSKQVGATVIRHVRRAGVSLAGHVLDYGCGPGFLLEELLNQGIACSGADFDAQALDEARKRGRRFTNFGGAHLIERLPSALPSGQYSTVFLLETIEHLIGDELARTLAEIHRVLTPGGHVVVTTPNEEDLSQASVLCPECGAHFHPVQHVSSWSASTLVATMESADFMTVTCLPLHLRPLTSVDRLLIIGARLLRRRPTNLLYLGRKRR